MPSSTGAAPLTWDATSETNRAGYKAYMAHNLVAMGTPIAVGNTTTYTIGNLTDGYTYYFSVTAVDANGTEGLHSTQMSKTVS